MRSCVSYWTQLDTSKKDWQPLNNETQPQLVKFAQVIIKVCIKNRSTYAKMVHLKPQGVDGEQISMPQQAL